MVKKLTLTRSQAVLAGVLRLALATGLALGAMLPPLNRLAQAAPLPTAPEGGTAAALELYGTFHAMGVMVTIGGQDDPDGNAVAQVEYRASSSNDDLPPPLRAIMNLLAPVPYRQGLALARVDDTRFVGSLFWLKPGTLYDVRVSLSDPGGALDGVQVEASAATRAELTLPAPQRSLHTRPDGAGTTCSQASPCSLQQGLNQAQAGDEVLLHDGVYYAGEMDLPRSGTAGAPIVVRSAPGETARLDGADPLTFNWAAHGGGVYRTAINAANPHLVSANGARLYPYQSLSDLQQLIWDTPGFYAEEQTLYVHLAEDADPQDATMVVSRYNYAFLVEQDSIYFLDLTFRHYGLAQYAKAIYFNNASDNLVQGCTFAVNDLGIGLKRDSHRNVIQDNTFYDTNFDWPWDAVKAGSALETGGVRFYDPTTGRGNVIRRNTFHDYFDGFGVCPGSDAGLTNETDVYDNLVYNAGDDGMETDGQCSNVRIWGNTFHDVLMGISLAPVYGGPVYAIRNLVYRTGVGNNTYTGSPFKFNSGYGRSGPMYLFHNTADAALADNNGLYIKAPGTWASIYARNNIWAGTAYALENYNTDQSLDLDYDNLWNEGGGKLVRWDNATYATLSDFTAAVSQEAHGLSVAPGFSDAAKGDYSLAAGSGLLDAGLIIPGINDDYSGRGPDIGAFERHSRDFSLSITPTLQAIAPGGAAVYTLTLQTTGSFTTAVTLSASSPSPSLTVQIDPNSLTPPGQARLRLVDTHPSGSALLPGVWYTIAITASSGDVTRSGQVRLLVGGGRVYLPAMLKAYPN